MRYTINDPMVITDDMDGEIIILNTESGKYFSTEKTGAIIWEMLSNNYTIDETTEIISSHFSIPCEIIKKDLNSLLAQFIDEGLLKVSKDTKSNSDIDLSNLNEYATPQITAYSDMEKLLLMDPVHEVENMGWPNVKKEEKK
ncbi:PqqD family protein [Tenacibaculum sp.]|nr:PqqD family protein [Tenacibaculum sp.]